MRKFKIKPWMNIPLGVIALAVVYFIYKKGKNTADKIKDALADSVTLAEVSGAVAVYGISPTRIKVIQEIAERIYNAFYKSGFGLWEDEKAAAEAFNELYGQGEAIVCATIYKASFKKSLYGDITEWCHGPALDRFRTLLLNAIKNK
jgi:hypothetical protein